MLGITTTALDAEALLIAATLVAANNAFDEAIEQAAAVFVLSGLGPNHYQASAMGVYERQEERGKVNGRFVYKDPGGVWAWSSDSAVNGISAEKRTLRRAQVLYLSFLVLPHLSAL